MSLIKRNWPHFKNSIQLSHACFLCIRSGDVCIAVNLYLINGLIFAIKINVRKKNMPHFSFANKKIVHDQAQGIFLSLEQKSSNREFFKCKIEFGCFSKMSTMKYRTSHWRCSVKKGVLRNFVVVKKNCSKAVVKFSKIVCFRAVILLKQGYGFIQGRMK